MFETFFAEYCRWSDPVTKSIGYDGIGEVMKKFGSVAYSPLKKFMADGRKQDEARSQVLLFESKRTGRCGRRPTLTPTLATI